MCIARYPGGNVWNNFMPIYDRSRNSRWRSSKPEVPIFQLVEVLATRFQIIIPRFWGRTIQFNIATPQRKSEFKMAVV